ncbi:MAG: amidohydrolase family protein [Acidobacteriota bacterium]
MNPVTIIGPGTVLSSFETNPTVISNAGVAIEEGRIIDVGAFEELGAAHPRAELLDAHGGLILPGLVNLHHHFYSALARGLDPGRPMRDFREILEGLWWRLDRALDAETVELSAALSLADCIRWGCTTVFDHHASPSFLSGSLELLADVVKETGLSAVLCYEVSDRNGHDEALAGLEENLQFASDHRDDPRLRGLLGLHASFTVSDATLQQAAAQRPGDLGVHIHLAEDQLDGDLSQERHGRTPLDRLDHFGLLDGHALLAHGVHLDPHDVSKIAESGATLIHNPESNSNNAVGRLDLEAALSLGCTVGLGTDGMSSAMLRSLRAAFLGRRAGTADPSTGFDSVSGLLAANARRAAQCFGEPLFGQLQTGAPADVIVIDGPPPTPVTPANTLGHMLYGASESVVRHTVARGRVLLKDFSHTTLDVGGIADQARAATPALWERFKELDPGS